MTTDLRVPVRQFARFTATGAACAVLFAVLFLLLRSAGVSPLAANIGATLATTVAGSAADRRFTFGARGPSARVRHHGQGILLLTGSLAISSTVFGLLDLCAVVLTTVEELAVANAVGMFTGFSRFLLLRHWVYRPITRSHPSSVEELPAST